MHCVLTDLELLKPKQSLTCKYRYFRYFMTTCIKNAYTLYCLLNYYAINTIIAI